MAIRIADLFTAGQEGRQAARDDQTRKGLASFFQGDQAAIGQVYQNAPELAFRAEGLVDDRRAAAEDRLGKLSTAFAQNPDPLIYSQWRQAAQGVLGPSAAPMPETLDDPADREGAIKAATAFAQAYGGAQKDNTPAAIRELQMLQANPELAALDMKRRTAGFDRPQLIQTDEGYAWATPDGATPLNYGGGTSNPITGTDFGIGETNNYVRSILGKVNIDPNATPEQQAEALLPHLIQQESGGNPNAVSPKGAQGLTQVMPATGRDPGFGVSPLRDGSPQENVRFGRDYLTAMLKRYPGRPDLALAAYNAGPGVADRFAQPQASAGGGRVRPPQKSSDTPKPSEFERKLEIARAMGATDDQLRQMVLGESGGGKPSATQIKLANTAKQKLIDLQAMDEQIAKVDEAFKRIQGSFSAGMGGNYLPTEAGRRFDAAVAVLKTQVRKLTRTPGEGAMSDYESKLAELANPSRGEYEQVTADQLEQLRALVETTRQGYEALLQDAGGSSNNLPGATSNTSGPQPGTVEAGYRFKGGNPADQSNWERI